MTTMMGFGYAPCSADREQFYSKVAKGPRKIISMATPAVLGTLESISFQKSDKPFVICDYGTADGGNSLTLIREVIKSIKLKYGYSQPVQVVYEDQPMNDFKPLFEIVHGLQSYLHEFKEVYVTVCGTNFFEQCLPAGTVHLGVSFTAAYFLSHRPCNLCDALRHNENKNHEENELFKEQAAKDWEVMLLSRAKEMAEGGELVVLLPGIDKKGQFIGKTEHIKKAGVQIITELWKAIVTEEEYINTNLDAYYRTEAEARAPFDDPESVVSRAGLRLIEMKIMLAKCPIYKEWEASERTQADAVAHAEKLLASELSWLYSTLISGLSDERTSEEKIKIVDEVSQRYKDIVAENPQDHFIDFIEIYLHIRKY